MKKFTKQKIETTNKRSNIPMTDQWIPTELVKAVEVSIYDNQPQTPDEYEKKRYVAEVKFEFEKQHPELGTEWTLMQTLGLYNNHAYKSPEPALDHWYDEILRGKVKQLDKMYTCVHGKLGTRMQGRTNHQYRNVPCTWITFDIENKTGVLFYSQPMPGDDQVDVWSEHVEIEYQLDLDHEDTQRKVYVARYS